MTERSSIIKARAKADAYSAAADVLANQWNLIQPRTTAWSSMTPKMQEIWKQLKASSTDFHQLANDLEEAVFREGLPDPNVDPDQPPLGHPECIS